MNQIPAYVRNVKYYETDCMKIVHHSNYIRWFEEARIDYFDQIGTPYFRLEEEGFVAPVLSVSCEYKSMTRFGEDVCVFVKLTECTGIRFAFSYRVVDLKTGALRCLELKHRFVPPLNWKKLTDEHLIDRYWSGLSQNRQQQKLPVQMICLNR